MTIVFMDSFDHYTNDDVLKKWTTCSTTVPALGAATGVNPAWACPPGGQGWTMGGAGNYLSKTLPATYTVGIIGCNYWFNSIAAGTLLVFADGDAEQCSIRMDASGHITVSRNGTLLATSTNTITQQTWYHIEAKVTVHNSTGTYEVRVNGTATNWIAAATGKNTRAQTNDYFTQVRAVMAQANCRIDDFYVLNCSSSPNNDFLGPQKIFTCHPKGVGNYSQWTANYMTNFENVREFSGDGNSTFNQSSTANQIDTFDMDSLPNATVNGIQHVIMARQDTGTGRTLCPVVRSGSTDYVGSTLSTTAGYVFLIDPKDVDPATSAQWTYTNFNGEEFGYKLLS
jgi:flagellar hook-associated protein FlgK